MPKIIDITGNKYGELTVLEFAGKKNRKTLWKCICECGSEKIVLKNHLISGNTKTCGGHRKNFKHGMCGTRIYRIWRDMRRRCDSPNFKHYIYYGEKGITYCSDWADFNVFHKWAMENGYSDELTIERVDSNGNYEPSNCRWATPKEQANNTSQNVKIEIDGITKTLQQWADLSGISRDAIRYRYRIGVRGTELLNPPDRTKRLKVEIMEEANEQVQK